MCYPNSSVIAQPDWKSSQSNLFQNPFNGSAPPSPLFHRSLRSEDISASLTHAIEAGDYGLTISKIQNNSRLIWQLNPGSTNPLHALANSQFSVEQMLVLSTHLLKSSCRGQVSGRNSRVRRSSSGTGCPVSWSACGIRVNLYCFELFSGGS